MYSLKALVIMILVTSSSAASIYLRGYSIECSAARVRILSALNDASGSVGKIKDPSVAQAAKAGVTQATSGIGAIAKSIFAVVPGPLEAGHSTIKAGLKAAAKALEKGDVSDPAVVTAQASVKKAQQAGREVVANC